MRLSRLCLCASAAALLVVGCGQSKMVETTGKMRSLMLERNYQAALATLRQSKEKGSFKEQDRVVFWMNEGMLLHLMGQYAESLKVLNQAEQRSKELYTTSISKTMKAAITSDAAKDYAGEDYENVLVNVVKALDHLAQNNLEGAGVEARRINEKLAKLKTDYGDKPFIYNQDAFGHWLSGLVLEMQKDNDAARIHYVKALEAYKTDYAANYGLRVPSFVAEDAARMAVITGEEGILGKLRTEFGPTIGASAKNAKAMGEIVLIHMNGEGPSKTDYFIDCYFAGIANWQCNGEPGGEFMKKTTITIGKGDTVKVAFPQLIIRNPTHAGATLTVGAATAMTEVAEPISGIAAKVLRDKTGRIFRDAVIRVITKFLAAKASEKAGEAAGGALGGFLAKNAASATMQAFEEADKRAWITLPSRIEVAKVQVPPGVYNVGVALVGGGSPPPIQGVRVEAGKRVILTTYTLP
jgi:uncharacterized protein